MIQIKINRWTVQKLEEALTKYNKEEKQKFYDYADIINEVLEIYLRNKQK